MDKRYMVLPNVNKVPHAMHPTTLQKSNRNILPIKYESWPESMLNKRLFSAPY